MVTKQEQFGSRHVPDVEWLEWCGSDWVVLTKDENIKRVKAEAQAIRQHKVRVFYIPSSRTITGEVVQRRLEHHWKRICTLAQTPGPYTLGIYSDAVRDPARSSSPAQQVPSE